jgi:DNA-binding MarR family transcriptional regulator
MSKVTGPRRRAGPQHFRGDDYRAEDSIGYLLRLSLSAIRRRLDRQMTRHALTGLQMLPLAAIGNGLCRTAAELARLNDTDPGATSRMLDRLEAKGLLQRARSAEDRRVVQLELTAAGLAIAQKIPFAVADTLNEALCDFSAAEVETLRKMLRRIVANAEATT